MFHEQNLHYGGAGGVGALPLRQAVIRPGPGRALARPAADAPQSDAPAIDWAPDLGADIGSRRWWRGAATLTGLIAAAIATAPGMGAIPVASGTVRAADQDELRTIGIDPLAYGGDSGRRMAPSPRVRPLASTPERPMIQLSATLGQGDGFARLLERSGVGGGDVAAASALVAQALPLSDLRPGTTIDLTLGRRPSISAARPLDALALRARFDLKLEVERVNGALRLNRIPIAVDATPLRIRGTVGGSLYQSARAAGAPASAVEAYLKVIGSQISVGRDIGAGDEFDIIVDYKRAETGEVEVGSLIYAGLIRNGRPRLRMLAWPSEGRTQWFEASGVGEQRGGLAAPVAGRSSSNFGMRRHPILGYLRMHSGMDYGAPRGAPIVAVTDGRVSFAGRKGGYGNFVRLSHDGGLGSGYGHMSRIAVRAGQSVRRGQVIGYVGSTGLSTGPHLHYELYRNGRAINPASVRYVTRAQLSGAALAQFRAKLDRVTRVAPGAALAPMPARAAKPAAPLREADRLPD